MYRNQRIGKQAESASSVHFSRVTVEWETPQWLFDELSETYGGFTLDPCATRENAKCERFFPREQDGLNLDPEVRMLRQDGRKTNVGSAALEF